MPEAKQQDLQGLIRPALKPFIRPHADEPRPQLRPATPAFGRVTLPPFGPIRYGGPKPGAPREDDEAPTWASIEEYVHTAPAPEVPEPEPEPVIAAEPEPEPEVEPEPEPEPYVAEELPPPPPPLMEEREEPMPWEAAPTPEPELEAEPEPMTRRPVLPLTGPNDPTPIMNQTIERTTERTTEPHRMTPMRVTPLRPSIAIPSTAVPAEPNARAVAAALEMVAARVRRGDLVVPGSMPANDDPPALAAVLAATLAALLGVRS